MKLSKNFSLNEFTKSQVAMRNGIPNLPTDEQIEKIKDLVENVLQPVRDHYMKFIMISSGFRSFDLNSVIGGSNKSQHSKGEAADFEIAGVSNYLVAKWISENLEFDQLILEFYTPGNPNSGWIHVSYKKGENRKQVLTATRENGSVVYHNGLLQ